MNKVVINNECLSEELMLRYLNDGCSKAEVKLVDRHLGGCDFCSDALEGAMRLSLSQLEKRLADIDRKLEVEHGVVEGVSPTLPFQAVKGGKYRSWFAAAAASAAILGGGIIYFISQKSTMGHEGVVAYKQDSVSTQIVASGAAAGSLSLDTGRRRILTDTNGVVPALALASETANRVGVSEPYTLKEDAANVSSSAPIAAAIPSKQKNEEGIAKEKYQATPTSTARPMDDGIGVVKDEIVVTTAVKKRKETEMVVTDVYSGASAQNSIPRADSANSVGYRGAKPSAKPTAKPSPPAVPSASSNSYDRNVAESSYQAGVKYYDGGKYKLAISEFNIVLARQSAGAEYESSLWLLANAYLKLNKKQEAKTLLKRVVSENNVHKGEAKEMLDKL